MRRIVFSQHTVRGEYYFYGKVWNAPGIPGKGLCLLEINGYYGTLTNLLPTGEARDPDISFDGKRVLFAWRGGESGSQDYSIFEMNLADRSIRRITRPSGSRLGNGYPFGCNDFEAIYLPNGNILFHSTRMIQQTDCTGDDPVCNMFLCDKDGRYIRRIGFDQVSTNYPHVLPSGEVVYCRWDYNDKSHTYAHALFTMNPDGTAQREYCNNNSWWPTMILHPRPIPGTTKLMAMIGGYHTPQHGKIGIIDVSKGMQNGTFVTLIAPVRLPRDDINGGWGGRPGDYPWSFDHSIFPGPSGTWPNDYWGQNGPMFAYPCPLDESALLVSHRPEYRLADWIGRFGLYFMKVNGERELLYMAPGASCCSPVIVSSRQVPFLANQVDYRKTTGVFQVMNIYTSQPPVLDGVVPGTIKRLRVVGLDYRSGPPVNTREHFGPGCINYGGASYNTPIATENASWDVKVIMGETPVEDDGSASFIVPARTPVYFQALDAKGHVVQTMRSWATLMPGETFSCMGCHESRLHSPPPVSQPPKSLLRGPLPLEPFYGPARGFSFAKGIQPILNAKCVSCHNATSAGGGLNLAANAYEKLVAHSREAGHSKYVNWFHAEDSPLLQPPYRVGSSKSLLVTLVESGQMPKGLAKLSREEIDKICCWIDIGVPKCGSYAECNPGADGWLPNRRVGETEEAKNIQDFLSSATVIQSPSPERAEYRTPEFSLVRKGCDIVIGVPGAREVRVDLFTMHGALVRTLFNGPKPPGDHTVRLDQSTIIPGRYLIRMTVSGASRSAQIVIVD